jgi:putative DNA primase/helicase
MAFVKQLYYCYKGNQQLMDECFRASGRMRPKWGEVHPSDGATSGEVTVRKSCRTNSEMFGAEVYSQNTGNHTPQ